MTAWVYVEGAPAGAGETRTGENGRALSPLAVVGTPTGTDGGTTTASTTPRGVLGRGQDFNTQSIVLVQLPSVSPSLQYSFFLY